MTFRRVEAGLRSRSHHSGVESRGHSSSTSARVSSRIDGSSPRIDRVSSSRGHSSTRSHRSAPTRRPSSTKIDGFGSRRGRLRPRSSGGSAELGPTTRRRRGWWCRRPSECCPRDTDRATCGAPGILDLGDEAGVKIGGPADERHARAAAVVRGAVGARIRRGARAAAEPQTGVERRPGRPQADEVLTLRGRVVVVVVARRGRGPGAGPTVEGSAARTDFPGRSGDHRPR